MVTSRSTSRQMLTVYPWVSRFSPVFGLSLSSGHLAPLWVSCDMVKIVTLGLTEPIDHISY